MAEMFLLFGLEKQVLRGFDYLELKNCFKKRKGLVFFGVFNLSHRQVEKWWVVSLLGGIVNDLLKLNTYSPSP